MSLGLLPRSCRTADVTLVGGEHVDIEADSPTGGTASIDFPALPAPDGSELLKQVQDRMHRLQTARSVETLGPVNSPIETQYAFQVPDRMQMDISNGSHTIFICGTRYTRNDQSNAGWQAEDVAQMGFVIVDRGGIIRLQRVDTHFGDHASQMLDILHLI